MNDEKCACGCGQPRPAYIHGHQAKTPVERFWAKVDRCGPDECWEWTGAKQPHSGHGALGWRGKTQRAHRIAYELEHGPIPEGLCVLHRCDNRPCCNPAHLRLGTHAENMAEMGARGRARTPVARGEHHPNARLSDRQVAEIRARAVGGASLHALSREFAVSRTHIQRLVRGNQRKVPPRRQNGGSK